MIEEVGKFTLVSGAAKYGQIDCLKYLIEEAKVPPHAWHVAHARYYEHPDCVNYLLERGSPEPTDEDYARFVRRVQSKSGQQSGD